MLIPAATENVITSRNADRIKARIICEGANGPTTAVADEILADKKVFVIPDILANAGGVTASYFEWVQDRQGYFWNEATVNERLEAILRESFDDVVALRRGAQRKQSHCGVYAGDRPGCVHDQAAGNLRISDLVESEVRSAIQRWQFVRTSLKEQILRLAPFARDDQHC